MTPERVQELYEIATAGDGDALFELPCSEMARLLEDLDEYRRQDWLVRKHLAAILHIDAESMSASAMVERLVAHIPPMTGPR